MVYACLYLAADGSAGSAFEDALSRDLSAWPVVQARIKLAYSEWLRQRCRQIKSRTPLRAADGVAPRRVVSHLAHRSGKTAILACVLLDGAVGEVLRLRPWPGHGCLLCQRAQLIAAGSIDPEPSLDRDYGAGDRHRPMTAVGSDLAIIGQLAAKEPSPPS